jgi:hypothetical protein
VTGYSKMIGSSYGSYDILVARINPLTWVREWVAHVGGNVHDYARASVVEPSSGYLYLLVDSSSSFWTSTN